MSQSVFIVAVITTFFYFCVKFYELNSIDPDDRPPIFTIVKDAFLVWISVLAGNYLFNMLMPTLNDAITKYQAPEVFTGPADF